MSGELVWTREMTRRFWAHESRYPENYFSFHAGPALVSRFRRHLAGRAADFGAGGGMLVEDLLRAEINVGAVEYDDEQAASLTERFRSNRHFLGARAIGKLNDWKEQFDVVFMVELIEHLYDDDLNRCMRSAIDLLRPGGVMIITTPNNEDRSKSMVCSPETGMLFHRYQHVRSWDEASLRAMVAQFGLRPVELKQVNFSASPHYGWRTRSLLLRLATSLRWLLSKEKPHLYAVAQKPNS